MIERVISGCQIGADIAGLRAAKRLGVKTGGWMPAGCRTQAGPMPQYARMYGIKETKSSNYPDRTSRNVHDSEGTIRFAVDWNSPGERATLREIRRFSRPYFDVDASEETRKLARFRLSEAVVWVFHNNIRVLNVAGNAKPEIEEFVEWFMTKLLKEVKDG